jgi:protein phosphatase
MLGGNEPGVMAEVHLVDLHAGDRLLLCSDGLTEMVPDERIAAVLVAEDSPEVACRRLIDEANRNGGVDNITVIVARFSDCN